MMVKVIRRKRRRWFKTQVIRIPFSADDFRRERRRNKSAGRCLQAENPGKEEKTDRKYRHANGALCMSQLPSWAPEAGGVSGSCKGGAFFG